MAAHDPKADTIAPPDTDADPGRARFAAALLDELAAPPAAPDTWHEGTHASEASDWLDGATGAAAAQARAELADLAARVGTTVGPYRLTSLLGRGGMGAVFAAERIDGAFAQRVALKLIIGAGARLASRFRRERAILARLDHPHIARLLDGGLSAGGEPWFAMELVDGVSLTGYCETHALGVRERIVLFLEICDAVAYAHRHLIVHRDLKPPNVLVTAQRDAKLLDFGIAKLVDRAQTDTALTRADERVLTPDYAAPEQILGQPVTTATDVYALGLLLFEMFTGERAQRLAGLSALEAERWVVNHDVATPSAVRCPHAKALRGDLDAIVGKALRKEPEHRYASAQALADDLRRHLDGHAIHARTGTWAYRSGKFARRNRLALAAATAVFATLLLGLAAAVWQAREVRLQAERAESVKQFVVDLFQGIDPSGSGQGGRKVSAKELLDAGIEQLRTRLDTQPQDQAGLMVTLSDLYAGLGESRDARALSEQALALLRAKLPADDARLLPALARVAQSAGLEGRIADSARLVEEANRLLDDAGPAYDDERLRVLQSGQLVAIRQGDGQASLALARRILALQEGRFGPDAPEIAVGLVALGWAYAWQNRYAEAEAMYRKALALKRPPGFRRYGGTLQRPGLEVIHMQLGNVLGFGGRYREAREQFELATAIAVKDVGDDHRFPRMLSGSIAVMDMQLGRVAEAEAALRAAEAASGAGGWRFDNWGLGRVLLARGNLAEATLRLRSRYEGAVDVNGAQSKFTHLIARDFGTVLLESGELAEAERILGAVLDGFARLETPSSYQYAIAESRLARLLLVRGDAAAAEPRARHAHATLLQAIGAHYDETMRAEHELGRALVALGRRDEGIAHLRRAALGYEQQFGMQDLRTAEYRFVLGAALYETMPMQARELLDASARDLVDAEGNELPVRARAEKWLATRTL